MFLIKNFSWLFLTLLLGVTTKHVEQVDEMANAAFVTEIQNDALKQHFAASFESIQHIERILLYQNADSYIYELHGTNSAGQSSVDQAIVPISVIGDADPRSFMACTCYINNMNWRIYKGKYRCDLYCIGFPF